MDDAKRVLAVTLADGSVAEHMISDGEVTVGRSRTNQIALEDSTVSRHHAKFVAEAGRILIEDVGSSVGTWLNSCRLAPNTQHEVHAGDEIRFGRLIARFAGKEDASEAPTSFMDLDSIAADLKKKTTPPPREPPPAVPAPQEDDEVSIHLPELGKRFAHKSPDTIVTSIPAVTHTEIRACPRCGRPLPPYSDICPACKPAAPSSHPSPSVLHVPTPPPVKQQPAGLDGLNPQRPVTVVAEPAPLHASPGSSLNPTAHSVATSAGTRTKPVMTLAAPGSDLINPHPPAPPDFTGPETSTTRRARGISPLIIVILLLLLLAFGLIFLWWQSAR